MKEYFKLTGRKILGIIILLSLFSFLGFFFQYIENTTAFATGEYSISLGLPLPFISIGSSISYPNNYLIYLVIDIIIFYLITVVLAIIFKRRKVENVPNSDSGGRDTSTPNQTQP